MEKIGVFCSASENIDQDFFEATGQLGEWMGREKKTLVYGGTNLGLMEHIAQAVKMNGGKVIGVVPAIIETNGRTSSIPDQIIPTTNLSDRKDIITKESDILVALPGGIGTLDEAFHVISAASIGYHSKKVIFYNINGFYNSLVNVLKEMETKNFIRSQQHDTYAVADSLKELAALLK
ncbi:TIGR00730 family Rossman fold protein [uncultured Bacteroides sp.]|uniref:LOG family protein n=1 Tax=uncultured Bacteroides sp. TaxID=162156 RepID=UPI002AAA709E|nr:TIGR00730 family Rossman fold protein [uncultured Bacteroides sp.]